MKDRIYRILETICDFLEGWDFIAVFFEMLIIVGLAFAILATIATIIYGLSHLI